MTAPAVKVVADETTKKSDLRKTWALIALVGGAVSMTAYALYCLWLIRANAGYVFYMGLAAHLQILLVLTGITGLLVRRSLEISKGKVVISDHDDDEEDLIPRSSAREAVDEALEETPAVTPTNDSTNKPS